MGYGADIVVTSEAFMYNYNMAQFYRKDRSGLCQRATA